MTLSSHNMLLLTNSLVVWLNRNFFFFYKFNLTSFKVVFSILRKKIPSKNVSYIRRIINKASKDTGEYLL